MSDDLEDLRRVNVSLRDYLAAIRGLRGRLSDAVYDSAPDGRRCGKAVARAQCAVDSIDSALRDVCDYTDFYLDDRSSPGRPEQTTRRLEPEEWDEVIDALEECENEADARDEPIRASEVALIAKKLRQQSGGAE